MYANGDLIVQRPEPLPVHPNGIASRTSLHPISGRYGGVPFLTLVMCEVFFIHVFMRSVVGPMVKSCEGRQVFFSFCTITPMPVITVSRPWHELFNKGLSRGGVKKPFCRCVVLLSPIRGFLEGFIHVAMFFLSSYNEPFR